MKIHSATGVHRDDARSSEGLIARHHIHYSDAGDLHVLVDAGNDLTTRVDDDGGHAIVDAPDHAAAGRTQGA